MWWSWGITKAVPGFRPSGLRLRLDTKMLPAFWRTLTGALIHPRNKKTQAKGLGLFCLVELGEV
ncbi:hypothetical protein CWE15_06675 [Aliidiomarina taiwanensis]|uniref:Uncharacterized protein n=1 Tax=Aliidiomarina taiwanensis TaxID=946228 RepID=A0A432X1L7_9GAMM|nr:hypothetical protein CWE15_06675 [Aliidiomarina taiwanensis]